MRYDILISGAGIVGLATALQLQRQRPAMRIAVLEKESQVAAHQSSHNSGVIHSGIYYRPGSMRALNCKRGYDLLLQFCAEQDIPHEICGKIIVAVSEAERGALEGILQRGLQNGLTGIRKMSASEVLEIEPNVQALEAIWVPQAGIVDYGLVARKYAEIFQANGGEIFLNQKVVAINDRPNGVVVSTQNKQSDPYEKHWETSFFVNASGLYSDHIARLTGESAPFQIIPFRGEFFALKPASQHLVRNLVYPVPNPDFPFLGVHFTRMIQGGIEAGPNAVLAFQREGYSRWELNVKELSETIAFPGFRKLARKYWREGWAEMQRSYSKAHFVRALQRLVPAIQSSDLVPDRSGVRAMACGHEGQLLDDFLILERPHVLNICNAPSPAATASLAIGETLSAKILERC